MKPIMARVELDRKEVKLPVLPHGAYGSHGDLLTLHDRLQAFGRNQMTPSAAGHRAWKLQIKTLAPLRPQSVGNHVQGGPPPVIQGVSSLHMRWKSKDKWAPDGAAHKECYFFFSSSLNFTPSPASFRLTPLVLGRR